VKKLIKSIRNKILSPVLLNISELNDKVDLLTNRINNIAANSELNEIVLYMDATATYNILKEKITRGIIINYESILERNYSQIIKPGDHVIDIGAHLGRHLTRFIELVGSGGGLLAFEPLENQYKELTQKFQYPNVKIHNFALSDTVAVMKFYENVDYPEESGLKERIYNNTGGTVIEKEVNVTTLDTLSNEITRLDYIKLDAEGNEIAILNGGINVISKFKPIISVEYGYPSYSVYGHIKTLFLTFVNLSTTTSPIYMGM